MLYTFTQPTAPSKRTTQYFEMAGNRGIYHDGWMANTTPFAPPWELATGKLPDVNDYKWELYNIKEDYSQYNDLAAKMPDKLKEMQALFLQEAAKYNVLPLDNTAFIRLQTPRPSAVAGKTVFTYSGEMSGIPVGSAPNVLDKDFTITADITVPQGGAEGMIVTMGGRFGGYGMYLLKGKPVFCYNLLDLERFRWEGGVGGRSARISSPRPSSPASTRSSLTSSTPAPVRARAAWACSRSTARRWPARASSTPFRCS